MKSKLHRSRFLLILLGVGLGYVARLVLGPPASEAENQNRFTKPLPDIKKIKLPDEDIHFDIRPGDGAERENETGLIPPIEVANTQPFTNATFNYVEDKRDFDHDSTAAFEPHGEQVCASGCALSRHPTGTLTRSRFQKLVRQYASEVAEDASPPLEELLFYGPQTTRLVESTGAGELSPDRAEFLERQLKRTHAKISLRVIDINGEIRTWLKPTRVPLDRRHVFEMETRNLQPLITSGTVKRVGLDHLWVRL